MNICISIFKYGTTSKIRQLSLNNLRYIAMEMSFHEDKES